MGPLPIRGLRLGGVSRWCVAGVLLALAAAMGAGSAAAERALVLDIDGVIGPAVADYLVRELKAAPSANAAVIVLRMNTPGGLDTSMRRMISAMLASPVPVVTYVAPSGAMAASAGFFILESADVAAMAPGAPGIAAMTRRPTASRAAATQAAGPEGARCSSTTTGLSAVPPAPIPVK